MATANLENKLIVTDPDFDNIRNNLKNFLRSQDTLADYDFEGSALSNLIDLLAYNTHYMAFYANMIANESFLDTASIRDSVVSHAKMLGYTPHSTRSAIAKINLSFTDATTAGSLTLPKFTKFSSASLDGTNYMFCNIEEQTVTKVDNEFKFINLNLIEGTPVNYVYTYNSVSNPQSEFEIPDAAVDTTTIEVIVQNSATDLTQETYTLSDDATSITESSKVYFLDETKGQKYKIYFGTGIIGKALSDGNIIIISYMISKGSAANKANNLTLLDSLYTNGLGNQVTNPTIVMLQAAAGGTEPEDIDSIKFIAPKSFISNNRAVTKNDYISLIQQKYPSIEAVNVWGGEENDPPAYGKIFVSVKPALGYDISLTEKQYIVENVIRPISMMTVIPEFVNPDYVYLRLDIKVTYDPTATTYTPGELESVVRTAVYNNILGNLNKFNSYFKLSRMVRDIDNSNPSVLSSEISITLEKRLEPYLGLEKNYTINFNTELKRSYGRNRIKSDTSFTMIDADSNYRSMYFEEIPSSFTGINSVIIKNGKLLGSNAVDYSLDGCSIEIEGDGVGAEITPVLSGGAITGVTINKPGTEYSTAKIVVYDAYGVELTDIVILPVLQNNIGMMRSYYLDDNQIKKTDNEEAGTIDYVNGVIKLNNFNPLDIDSDLKVLKILAEPQNSLFVSGRNSILTVDIEDVSATKITIIPVKQ